MNSVGATVVENVDVSNDVSALLGAIGDKKVDYLINNAGVLTVESFDSLDFEAMKRQYEVNSLGPLRVTNSLSSNLCDGSSKVFIITSRMGSIAGIISFTYLLVHIAYLKY